jgi:hypothetical protein
MTTYSINQKINEIAKVHGIRTIEEVLLTAKEPNHYYSDMPETMNPKRTIEILEAKIEKAGFQYLFEADEEIKGAIAQKMVFTAAQLIKTIQA